MIIITIDYHLADSATISYCSMRYYYLRLFLYLL